MKRSEIQTRLQELFATHPVVVWVDPANEFADSLAELDVPNMVCFADCNGERFELKAAVNTLTADERLLIYRPGSPDESESPDWLADVMSYAPVFAADTASIQLEELGARDTPEMRSALHQFSPLLHKPADMKRVQAARSHFETPNELALAVMVAALKASVPATADWALLAFIQHAHEHDITQTCERLRHAGAWGSFCQMIRDHVGFSGDAEGEDAIAMHVIMTALCHDMQNGASSDSFATTAASFPTPDSDAARHASEMLHLWLHVSYNAGPLREALYRAARKAECVYHLADELRTWPTAELATVTVFPVVDRIIATRVLDELIQTDTLENDVRNTLAQRRTGVWHSHSTGLFSALEAMLDMCRFQKSHSHAIASFGADAKAVWDAYVADWYRMDTAYRKFHAAFPNALNEAPDLEKSLRRLADLAESQYRRQFLRETAAAWERTASGDLATLGQVTGIPRQLDFFMTEIDPLLRKKKQKRTWVIISDALRYEVAVELAETLERTTQGQARVTSMQAGFPSITSHGMAALLPHASLKIAHHENSAHDGLAVNVDRMSTQGTAARQAVLRAYLDAHHPGTDGVALQSSALLKMSRDERKSIIGEASVVYLYHNRIDAIGDEAATEDGVFNACAEAIDELQQLVRLLVREFRASNILITADHGFLYTAQPLNETDKVSPSDVQGEIVAYGKRYIVGRQNLRSEALLPVNLETVSDGELRGFAPHECVRVKKAGGGENYVHGGISLQELCVPIVRFKNYRSGSKGYRERSHATLSLVSPLTIITNLDFEVEVLQNDPIGSKTLPALYELQVVGPHNEPVTDVGRLAADSQESETVRRTTRVTLHVREQFASMGELRCRLIARIADDDATGELGYQNPDNSDVRTNGAEESVLSEPVLRIAFAASRASDW